MLAGEATSSQQKWNLNRQRSIRRNGILYGLQDNTARTRMLVGAPMDYGDDVAPVEGAGGSDAVPRDVWRVLRQLLDSDVP